MMYLEKTGWEVFVKEITFHLKNLSVEISRRNACNPFTVYEYFDLLEQTVQNLGLMEKPEKI